MLTITGRICDLQAGRIFFGEVLVQGRQIVKIDELDGTGEGFPLIMPGLVDAHIHIESSLLTPREFWRMAIRHGTLATVSDPHEIANVLGIEGVRYMIDSLAGSPFITCWGAPSCVPATNASIETAGAKITIREIEALLQMHQIGYLSEVMNYPAVLSRNPEIMAFIAAAQRHNKPIDGHAPGLRGEEARQYAIAGISTDHECFTLEEALDKINAGMKIIIREGSAAKNYGALHTLLQTHPDSVMFCSDDKHPHELREGHINFLVAGAINDGYDPISVLRAASLNPIRHYNLPLGLLEEGGSADFVVVDALSTMRTLQCYLRGEKVFDIGDDSCSLPYQRSEIVNNFSASPIISSKALAQPVQSSSRIRVISVTDGALITGRIVRNGIISNGYAVSSPENNLLKIVVVNRYHYAKPAIGFCENFGLLKGAIASSVSHDSHNIVAVGANDEDIAAAINLIIASQGGLSVVNGEEKKILPLPIAGLMSDLPGDKVADLYEDLHKTVRELGSTLHDPLMMLSFMALPVIGHLKMTDRGLFATSTFSHVPLFV